MESFRAYSVVSRVEHGRRVYVWHLVTCDDHVLCGVSPTFGGACDDAHLALRAWGEVAVFARGGAS